MPKAKIGCQALDQVTKSLYQQYRIRATKIASSAKPCLDALIRNLHFVYKFSVSSLAEMTKLSKRGINVILMELKRSTLDILLQPESTHHTLCGVQEIKKMVTETIFSKAARITIPMVQARSWEVLHKIISASKVRKILTKDLPLT